MRSGTRQVSGESGRSRSARVLPILCIALLALIGQAGCGGLPRPRPRPPATPNDALYQQAKDFLEQRRFEKARQMLSEIGTHEVQSPDLDPLVKLALADAYFYQSGITNLIDAQSRYAQFLTFYPSSPLAGYAQFQVGMCYYKQSPQPHHDQTYTRKAIEEFDKVAKIDPTGRFVRASEVMRERCMDKLAFHDFQVGIFYFKRKAYAGVASRLRQLLDTYPNYKKSDGVYYYLGISLIKSGNQPEGRIYLEKLQRDFPASKFAASARSELGRLKS